MGQWRVLHLRQSGASYGPEQTILGLCRALPEFGFDCRIGLIYRPVGEQSSAPGALPMQAEARRQGTGFEHWEGAPRESWRMVRSIREMLAREEVDVIHAHDYKANWAALWAVAGMARGNQRPVLISTPRHSEQSLVLRVLQAVDRWALRGFDRIVEASPVACERMRGVAGVGERVRLVRHGLEAGTRGKPQELPETQGEPVVLLAGRLEAVKGHAVFLQAMAALREQVPGLQVWLAGEGSLRGELERLVRELGLGGRVHFLGYREDIGHVMAHASVAVIASQYETSCRVAMEALEFGCPLVSTPVGIVPELSEAEQTVLLTAAEPQAMAAAVRRVLEEPGLAKRMRERGQALVERDGGHRRAAQEMAAVYQEALAERLRGNK